MQRRVKKEISLENARVCAEVPEVVEKRDARAAVDALLLRN